MTVALTMIVKDEAEILPVTLPTYLGLIDSFTILDTGSTDGTQEIALDLLVDLPGEVYEAGEWTGYGDARTEALRLARDTADWLFMPDADMLCEAPGDNGYGFPQFREWLDADPDASVDAWQIEVVHGRTRWRKPLLLRGNQEWRYEFPYHEYLDTTGRGERPLLGLALLHGLREKPLSRFDDGAELLRPLAEQGEPRAQFYLAECLRFAGKPDDAAAWYDVRAANPDGFDEERWYSAYTAAKLREDVGGLIEAWEMRPWRHEPLTAAARIVAAAGPYRDVLFLEAGP